MNERIRVTVKGKHFDCPDLDESNGAYIDTVYRCLKCGKVGLCEGEAYPTCVGPFALYYFRHVETLTGEVLYEPRTDRTQ